MSLERDTKFFFKWKIHLLYIIKGYNMAENNYLVELAFNFEQISCIVLVFPLLTLNKEIPSEKVFTHN